MSSERQDVFNTTSIVKKKNQLEYFPLINQGAKEGGCNKESGGNKFFDIFTSGNL